MSSCFFVVAETVVSLFSYFATRGADTTISRVCFVLERGANGIVSPFAFVLSIWSGNGNFPCDVRHRRIFISIVSENEADNSAVRGQDNRREIRDF